MKPDQPATENEKPAGNGNHGNHSRDEIILTAENVSLQYDKLILRDVNFTIRNITRPGMNQGQVVSLIGRSGIGKTQLFKILAGLNKPTTGTVKIHAEQRPVKAGDMGIVPQNYILFNHRTVFENLSIGLKHSGQKLNDKDIKDTINQKAELFDLRDHLKKYPMQLSGGQRQRVSILQQVLAGNHFILFDEPFSGLDMIMIDRVVELLLKVSCMHEHNTLVVVSHDVENAMAISDTVYILARQEGKEGATITETIDLMHMGLAWEPDIRSKPAFRDLLAQIKHKI
jgi:ABC-type nitrate/sulfonate/bicarbonate transport system ATPase subunit